MQSVTQKTFENKINLKTSNGIEIFNIPDLICFFIENSEVKAHIVQGRTIRLFHTLIELEVIFTQYNFYRCHAKSMVNLAHLSSYNHKTGCLRLSNNIELKVAWDRKVKFKQLIYNLSPP